MKKNKFLAFALILTLMLSMIQVSTAAAVVIEALGDVELSVGYRVYTTANQETAIAINLDSHGETVQSAVVGLSFASGSASFKRIDTVNLPAGTVPVAEITGVGQLTVTIPAGSAALTDGTLYQVVFASGADPCDLTITSATANTTACQYNQATFVTGINIPETALELFGAGDTQQLTPVFTPDSATYTGTADVEWTSDEPSVATVSVSGLVTAVTVGTATLTVQSLDGHFTDTCSVTVSPVFTLTYNGNNNTGGTAPASVTEPTGTAIPVAGPGSLVRTHYSFDGWNTQANGQGTDYAEGASLTITADTTLYAQWQPVRYTLSYHGNGNTSGTVPDSQTADYNTEMTVADPGDLAKTGYYFIAWNSKQDGTGSTYAIGAQFNISGDVTLYAQWSDQYTLSYQGNGNTGGTAPTGATYTYNDLVTVAGPGDLVRTHYTFTGWNTAADGKGAAYEPADKFNITAQTTLYAQWQIDQNTISYAGNGSTGGTAPADQPVDYGAEATIANQGTLTRTDYTFTGWNTAADGTGTAYAAGAKVILTADLDLYAQWRPNYCTVSYDGNSATSGTVPTGGTFAYNAVVTVAGAGTLVRDHYSFNGWNTKADGTGTSYSIGDQFTITVDTILYARWKIDQHTLTYLGNTSTGGTVPASQTVDHGTQLTVAAVGTLVKTDYHFTGWNTAADGTGTAYAAGASITITGNTTLYAQWAINQYTLTYDGNGSTGGTAPSGTTANAGTVLVVSAAGTLVKANATFNGWNTATDGTGTAYAAGANITLTGGDITLYAQWLSDRVTLAYNGNGSTGGTVPASTTVDYGSGLTVAARGDLTRTHYSFTGWNTLADGTGTAYAAGASITLTGDVTLYAQWSIDQFTLTYDGNGQTSGTAPTGGTDDYNAVITVAGQGDLIKTDYNFTGWNSLADGSGTAYAAGSTFSLIANVTLYAQWQIASITVTFDKNGGDTAASPATAATAYQGTVSLPTTNPTRSGYKFVGWNTAADGSGTDFTAATTVTADITVYAHWLQSAMSGFTIKNGGYNSIRLSWDANAGADGYSVYRSTAKDTGFKRIAYGVTDPAYNDEGELTTGKTYYYKVRAYGIADGTHTYSSYTEVLGKKPIPAKPGNFKVSPASYTSLKLSWNEVDGADGYRVYRATSQNGTYEYIELITNATTTTLTDTGLTTGKTYYYKLRAYTTVSGNDIFGTMTAVVSRTVVPGKTSSYTVKATGTAGELLHSWSAVSGATGYQIWVSDAADGTFTKVTTVKGATTYTETGLESGTTRYYKIRAYRTVNGNNYFGQYTSVIHEGTPD